VTLFVLVLGLPALLRAFATSPAHGVAFVTGLLFVAGFAVGAGSLSRGGKLFSGVYTALWYMVVAGHGAGPLDFCGAFGGGLGAGSRLAFLAIGAAAVALAAAMEQRRRAATAR
jgi:hypothetical protein